MTPPTPCACQVLLFDAMKRQPHPLLEDNVITRISYCALHRAAQQMREALQGILLLTPHATLADAQAIARAALTASQEDSQHG